MKKVWEFTLDELKETVLFHGTSEKIEGELRGGFYDNILWTAESSTVAQNYIPTSGITSYLSVPMHLDDRIRPEGLWYSFAQKLGYKAYDIDTDSSGRITGWCWVDNKAPTYREMINYVENELGYQQNDYSVYEVKSSYVDGEEVFFPNNYKLQGELFIFTGKENLNIFDYTVNRDGDLMNPDYHKLNLFKKAEKEGYDGIKIHDYAQSKNWGNVGHVSIGLFTTGISKLNYISIPAVNFDWDSDVTIKNTPEFTTWYSNQIEDALQKGMNIPSKVLTQFERA